MAPGAPLADAPLQHAGQPGWLLQHVGQRFVMLLFVANVEGIGAATREVFAALAAARIPVHTLLVADREGPAPAGCTLLVDQEHLISRRLDGRPGTAYLLRPDQHVCARWRRLDLVSVQDALARATGNA